MANFDQAQSPRLGQRLPPENPGVQCLTFSTLPEVAYKGQICYLTDLNVFLVYDGTAWQEVTGGSGGGITVTGNRIYVQSSDPTVSTVVNAGDLWYNPTTKILLTWDGSAWQAQNLGSGSTITGSLIRTAASGQRTQMRDDGSAGIIEFFTGLSGEQPGFINPQINSGLPIIYFQSGWTTTYPQPADFYLRAGDHAGPTGGTARTMMHIFPFVQMDNDLNVGGDIHGGETLTLDNQPRCLRWKTGTTSILNNSSTNVSFGSGSGGDLGITDIGPIVGESTFQVSQAGMYMVVASVGWEQGISNAGRRGINLVKNGTTMKRHALDGAALDVQNSTTQISGMFNLAANDQISVECYHNAGSGINIHVLGDSTLSYFEMYKMG